MRERMLTSRWCLQKRTAASKASSVYREGGRPGWFMT